MKNTIGILIRITLHFYIVFGSMIILTIVILPNLNLKELEKEEQTKPTASKRKEIIKIRAEINENKTQKKRGGEERSKKQSWFFEKLNRIN